MTTYATPETPSYGGPPAAAPPRHAGGPPTMPPPARRSGILAAATGFIIATGAAVTTAIALAHPATPAQHTVNVTPPPPVAYSSAEIQAAKTAACSAWDGAARSTALASKAPALTAPEESTVDARNAARAEEKRVGIAQIAFLRSRIGVAVPAEVASPMKEWIATEIDRLHFVNMRDWPASDTALNRGNDLVDVIAPACGLR